MKPILKKIDGILLLDKPLHITSNGALQRVKRLLGAKKAGHTGSLDPLASGMLPICFGEATKVSQFLLDSDKYYEVEGKLGIKTTTGDAEGEVVATLPVTNITSELIQAVMQNFLGNIQQIPPMFSALKHKGKPVYELARQGLEVERKPRPVTIHALQFISNDADTFRFTVHCTKGTYVRTLVEDMGDQLGCGAHVSRLRRSSVAPYQCNKMYSFEELEEIHSQYGQDSLIEYLLPVDSSVQHLPEIKLSSSSTFYMRMGQPVMVSHSLQMGSWVRIFSDDQRFMGIGEILEDRRVAPRRLVSAPSRMVS
jgi:tRNA pseudouridine55 synthase